jgi:6-phosphogluconolactonase
VHGLIRLDYTLKILEGTAALAEQAAGRFINLAAEAQQRRSFMVALSGGTTPHTLYTLLSSEPHRSQVDWTRIDFFFADERAVPPDHAASNYRLASESLFCPAGVLPAQIHRMRGEMEDLNAASNLYTNELMALVEGGIPRFDLIFLGLGPDGHTASLFPNSGVLQERTRWVAPVLNAPKPPPRRLTLTVPVLNAAREVIFLVCGIDKAAAVCEVLQGIAPGEQYPAKLVRPTAGRLLWLLDKAAASSLS